MPTEEDVLDQLLNGDLEDYQWTKNPDNVTEGWLMIEAEDDGRIFIVSVKSAKIEVVE